MSLFKTLLLMIPLVLAACGFSPVYGPGGTGNTLQNQVLINDPDTQEGYLLTRHMETRLGRGTGDRFGLDLKIVTKQEGLAINTQGDITRFNLIGAVSFALTDVASGNVVTSGTVDGFTGYSATGSTVATLAAERDAKERLMVLLGDQIIARLFAADIPS